MTQRVGHMAKRVMETYNRDIPPRVVCLAQRHMGPM